MSRLPQDKTTLPLGITRSDVQTTGRLIAATLLRQALGFRDCQHSVIDELVRVGHVVTLGKGETLVGRGDPFDKLCFVILGALEVSVLHGNGRRSLLAYLQPGDMAGTISLSDHLPHPSDLISPKPHTRVLIIYGDDWRTLRQLHPSLSYALEMQMAYRSRLLHERLIVDSSMSLEVRLARQLHLLSTLSGRSQSNNIKPSLRLSQADLGDLLGVGRPRANDAVQQLKKEGLIDMRYAIVTILDPVGLAWRAGL